MRIDPHNDKTAKALSFRAIEAMKPTSKELADSGENRGLRVTCGAKGIKTFIYRYRSPITNKLVQISIGHYPTVSLAEARLKCAELKLMRANGRMLDIEPWTPHDLRRTVRTGLSRLDCPNEVAEAILGHSRSGIEGTYDLHKYEKEYTH